MIHFDLADRYEDEHVVGSAISRREGVLFSVAGHAVLLLALLFAPRLALFQPNQDELKQRQQELERQRDQDNRTMVFVQPRLDTPAPKPPQRAELSDLDRKAQAPQAAPNPTNPLPYMRGNSAERNEASEAERARGPETPTPPTQPQAQPQPESTDARLLPPSNEGILLPPSNRRSTPPAGVLGDAIRNLQKYVQNETFDNPQGGQKDPGATIQFDTKGVEFGPWLRRFVSRVKRNWFVPEAAFTMRGHVVLQFNIWKDGHITDIRIAQPSSIEGFTNAAVNAIMSSNPVDPLPPDYPSEKAFFTVTFYYNELPAGQ